MPMILDTLTEWIEAYREDYARSGIKLSVTMPQKFQTKRSIVIRVEGGGVKGAIYVWETGELDTELADFSKDPDAPLEECVQSESTQFSDDELAITHIRNFLEQAGKLNVVVSKKISRLKDDRESFRT